MALITRGKMHNAIVGVATESTAAAYGTLVDPATEWHRLMAEDLDHEKITEFGPGLGGGKKRTPYVSSKKNVGSVTMPLDYEGIEVYLYQLFGVGKTVVDNTTYGTWTFKYAEALPMGLSLHASCDLKKWEFAGMKINTAEFKFEPRKVVMATFGFIGHSATTDTVDSPAYASINDKHPVLCTHLSAASHGFYYGDSGSEADVTSYIKTATVKINNNLGPTEPASAGYNTLTEPVRTKDVDITTDLVMWFQNDNAVADFLADTDVGFKALAEGGIISGSDKYCLDFLIPYNRITPTCKPKTTGAGLYEVSFSCEGYLQTSATPAELITVTLENSNTTSIDDS